MDITAFLAINKANSELTVIFVGTNFCSNDPFKYLYFNFRTAQDSDVESIAIE